MELWIVVTIAAAFFQTVRFMLQKLLSASALSSAGATFARFLYSAPLAFCAVGWAEPDIGDLMRGDVVSKPQFRCGYHL